jgi:hypothetical protein
MPTLAEISWGLPFLFILCGCLVLVWLYALIDCLRRKDFARRERIGWAIAILFTSYLGMIAYFVFCNRDKRRLMSHYSKAVDPVTGKPYDDASL